MLTLGSPVLLLQMTVRVAVLPLDRSSSSVVNRGEEELGILGFGLRLHHTQALLAVSHLGVVFG